MLKVLEEARVVQGSNWPEVQLDNQIGMIHFMQQDFGKPCLTSTLPTVWPLDGLHDARSDPLQAFMTLCAKL